MQNINIEDIMAEIREEICRKGYKDEEIQFNDIILSSVVVLGSRLIFLERLCNVLYRLVCQTVVVDCLLGL